MSTESRNPRSYGLDHMSAEEIVRLMDEEEYSVLRALQKVQPLLAQAVERVAGAFASGGRIVYVGAGTSGRIAAADAAEMPPTFGVDPKRFVALVAGGPAAAGSAVEDMEDDEHTAIAMLNELDLSLDDVVIGVAASGKTPFTISAIRHANQKGVWTCGIANNKNTPLVKEATLGIVLDTGPEVLTGSTRLKAGTAQKLALNRISTGAMVLSGKVIENLMVDVTPKNSKLKQRCIRIVRELTNATEEEARLELERCNWNTRCVVERLREGARR